VKETGRKAGFCSRDFRAARIYKRKCLLKSEGYPECFTQILLTEGDFEGFLSPVKGRQISLPITKSHLYGTSLYHAPRRSSAVKLDKVYGGKEEIRKVSKKRCK
jgi:hypothetical protein